MKCDSFQEINIHEISGFFIGNAEDSVAGTGCTVIISPNGAAAGCDIRGGGPATRETDLLKPEKMIERIHAVVLSGGSAFGLEAASGVMRYLEEKEIGFDTGFAKVPIVCGASLYDLDVGDSSVRPDIAMGRAAAINAFNQNFKEGNFGAGTGATVGKYFGSSRALKSGIGAFAVKVGSVLVGAISAVNAIGDVLDLETGKIIAGLLDERGIQFADAEGSIFRMLEKGIDIFAERSDASRGKSHLESVGSDFPKNTTLTCILTNADLSKTQINRLAAVAHDGFARTIRPVHTSADGDAIFAMTTGGAVADPDILGALASNIVAKSINRAVLAAEPAFGMKCAGDIKPD